MSLNLKLAIGAITVAAASAYLAYLGAASSWQYYVHVDECSEQSAELLGHRLRLNGHIAAGSLTIQDDRQLASFVLGGKQSQIQVTCTGPLPDNLAEDMDVVVEGTLERPTFLRGDRVLTRCASKYEASDSPSPPADGKDGG